MRIVNSVDMQSLDREVTRRFHVPALELMERAGRGLADWAEALLPRKREARVVVLAGGGKNGGDGLVCARFLAGRNVPVQVWLFGRHLAPETQVQLRALVRTRVPLQRCPGDFPAAAAAAVRRADVIVDALLGIGLTGAPREPIAGVIRAVNASSAAVLAADVPSGLDADSGIPQEPTIRAQLTLTFGLPKAGLLAPAAADYVSQVEVESLGFPEDLMEARKAEPDFVGLSEAAQGLPRRPALAHKRSAGKVLIVGGSAGFHGAPILAAAGAKRAGAGYVYIAYPRTLDAIIRAGLVEEIPMALPAAKDGALAAAALAPLLAKSGEADAAVIGPGLGRDPRTQKLILDFLSRVRGLKAVVVDADALFALAHAGRKRLPTACPLILTPHEGEAAALLGLSARDVAANRWPAAREIAARYHAVVVLKGRFTCVAQPGAQVKIVGTGTPALATAGTGDVLGGVIAAFAAQGIPPDPAAVTAAFVHGWAGQMASPDPGGLGVTALDVAQQLPAAAGCLRRRLHPRLTCRSNHPVRRGESTC